MSLQTWCALKTRSWWHRQPSVKSFSECVIKRSNGNRGSGFTMGVWYETNIWVSMLCIIISAHHIHNIVIIPWLKPSNQPREQWNRNAYMMNALRGKETDDTRWIYSVQFSQTGCLQSYSYSDSSIYIHLRVYRTNSIEK